MLASEFDPPFYKAQLQKVSRSFAFCIEELKDDLQADVALAYLLFRVLDTIEDSAWKKPADQQHCFHLFNEVLRDASRVPELVNLLTFCAMKKEEAELVDQSKILFAALENLPERKKASLKKYLLTMSQGMEYFALEKKHLLQNIAELNLYCYFVAGCIGELLSSWTFEEIQLSEELYQKSIHFGLFLQKTNILKDFQDDQKAGRNFLYSWQEAAASLPVHARQAYEYIRNISPARNDYKIFCAWSFFLGLLSYPYIEKSLQSGKAYKVSRLESWALLKDLKAKILAEKSLDSLFEKLSQALYASSDNKARTETSSSLAQNTESPLLKKLHPESGSERLKSFDFA